MVAKLIWTSVCQVLSREMRAAGAGRGGSG